MKKRSSSLNLSKLARADISCQFMKTRSLCRTVLNGLTLKLSDMVWTSPNQSNIVQILGEHDLGNDESVERCCTAENTLNNYRCALGHYPGKILFIYNLNWLFDKLEQALQIASHCFNARNNQILDLHFRNW